MVYVIATANVRPESRETYLEAARICIAATRNETGCLAYDLHQSVTDPNRFVFVERWTSREALEAHFTTDHLQTFRGIAKACIAIPTAVEIIAPQTVDRL
jgi:quinol monooxygenase YgiN